MALPTPFFGDFANNQSLQIAVSTKFITQKNRYLYNQNRFKMKTLQIEISDQDYSKYNLENKGLLSFAELEDLISIEYAKKSLTKCAEIAEQSGLSKMTLEEINSEIKAVRDAKNNIGH